MHNKLLNIVADVALLRFARPEGRAIMLGKHYINQGNREAFVELANAIDKSKNPEKWASFSRGLGKGPHFL